MPSEIIELKEFLSQKLLEKRHKMLCESSLLGRIPSENVALELHKTILEDELNLRINQVNIYPIFYYNANDEQAQKIVASYLEESRTKPFNMGKGKFCVCDQGIPPNTQDHIHVYLKTPSHELYSVNRDGSAHHGKWAGVKIPNKDLQTLQNLYGFPKNQIITESTVFDIEEGCPDWLDEFMEMIIKFYYIQDINIF